MLRLADPDPNSFPEDVRELLSTLPPDPMVKMLAHSVGTVKLFIQLARAQFTSLELPARSRETVRPDRRRVRRVRVRGGAQHEPIAREAGVDERTIEIIGARDLDSAELSPYDRALIRFTAEVVRSPRVSDELFAEVRQIMSDREIVEVLQMIGYYWSFSRICTVLDVELTKVYSDERVVSGDDGRADLRSMAEPDSAPTPSDQDASRRRLDARRNQERVIAAARELFTEQGLQVTCPRLRSEPAWVGRRSIAATRARKT